MSIAPVTAHGKVVRKYLERSDLFNGASGFEEDVFFK
jgi:hypothetical protein